MIARNLTRQLRVPQTKNRQLGPGLGSERVTAELQAGGPHYRSSTPCRAKRFSRLARLQSGCGAQSSLGVQSESGVLSDSGVHPASCSNSTTSGLHGILRKWREAGDVKVAWNRTSIPLCAIMAWYLVNVTQLHVCHFLYLTIFHVADGSTQFVLRANYFV